MSSGLIESLLELYFQVKRFSKRKDLRKYKPFDSCHLSGKKGFCYVPTNDRSTEAPLGVGAAPINRFLKGAAPPPPCDSQVNTWSGRVWGLL